MRNRHTFLWLLAAWVMIAIITWIYPTAALAQTEVPPSSGGAALENAQATATAAVDSFLRATAETNGNNLLATVTVDIAAATNFPATVTAAAANIQATANAVQGNIVATPTPPDPLARANAILSTVQAVSTTAALDNDDRLATAAAVQAQLPERLQALTRDELETFLDGLSENGSLTVDQTTQTIAVTYNIQEPAANAALDAALQTAGYEASAASVDFIAEGALVTIEDAQITESIGGRVLVLIAISAADGRLVVSPVFVTVNDEPVPQDVTNRIAETIAQSIDDALNTTDVPINYTVTDAFTTDGNLVISLVIPFNIAG